MNPVMEPWAERLQACMKAAGKQQADLARACKIEPGSVSGWFGKGKATKMISGDNLIACCTLLEVNPAYVMTGKGPVQSHSQPARFDAEIIADAMGLLDELDAIAGLKPTARPNPDRLAIACGVLAGGPVVDGKSNVVLLSERLRAWEQQRGDDKGATAGPGTADGGAHGHRAQGATKPAARRKG